MTLDDPEHVREECASAAGLRGRRDAYASPPLRAAEAQLPDFEPPFVVRRHPTIFVAQKA